mmetsp:Transcript_4096/g.11121  ORF Transcript_4096/g.11121 Transcript_4096/m.11121 type:complete len:202 (+) Transcript_4096:1909-2514(+)
MLTMFTCSPAGPGMLPLPLVSHAADSMPSQSPHARLSACSSRFADRERHSCSELHPYLKAPVRKMMIVLGSAAISTELCLHGSDSAPFSSVLSRVTVEVPGPMKWTTLRRLRFHVRRKSPSVPSSASWGGYSASSSSRSERLARAGVRSSTCIPTMSPQEGWMRAASFEMNASLLSSTAFLGASGLLGSSHATLPFPPVPR